MSEIFLSEDQVDLFLAQMRKAGIWYGFGVLIVLAGIGGFFVMPFFPLIAAIAAMPIFIVVTLRLNNFGNYFKQKIIVGAHVRAELQERNKAYVPQFYAIIAVAILMVILAIILIVVSGQRWTVPVLLPVLGFSAFLVISSAMVKFALDTLLGRNKKES
jgi:hypothetical protein